MEEDIRWKQRLSNYSKALNQLKFAVELRKQRKLSELEGQGLIKAFEFTHELAWNVMKDFFEYQGNFEIKGSRDATREAFHHNLISDGENWMAMIKSRNDSSHTYNELVMNSLQNLIIDHYFNLFSTFQIVMTKLAQIQ